MVRVEHGRIVVGITIRCRAEKAWRLLCDTRQWPHWGPSVAEVSCTDRYIGPDSAGRVKTSLGFWVPFAITEYRELQYWRWRIGVFPATGHRLWLREDGTCTVDFDMPWWALPYIVVCRIALGRIRRMLTSGDFFS